MPPTSSSNSPTPPSTGDDQLGADTAKKPAKKFSKGFLGQRLRSLSSPPVPLPGLFDLPDSNGTFGFSGGSLPRPGSGSSSRRGSMSKGLKRDDSDNSSPVDSPLMERGGDHQPRGRRSSIGSLSLKRSASGPSSWGRGRDMQLSSAISLLPEFKQLDTKPQRQRRLLIALERRSLLDVAKEKADRRKSTGGVREKLKNAVRTSKDDKKGALSAKLQSLWKQKKSKRTRPEDFHLLLMAVHDHQSSIACSLLNEMPPSMFTKGALTEPNKVFMLAMANAMEPVCMIMMDKGFPADVNAPVLKSEDSPFSTPSYFMMTVGLRLHNLVFHMIQHHRVKVNADWYGITPLHVAACKGALTVVNMLLEHGANPRQGLPIVNYRLLRRLKNTQPKDKEAASARMQTISKPRNPKRESMIGSPGGGGGVMDPQLPQPRMEEILPIDCASVWQDQEMVNALLAR
ncbi:hypothetical protein HDU87_008173 [Geranomyces variabilis]|uniref:Ankyrin repeat protein n=1 Tax=Geranomyces variabilis TaxID=109894 RepID=A0AAD5TFR1_9FUNG|nr:hypothetical protein HDU87_008173 [Geranomyces variabilis]